MRCRELVLCDAPPHHPELDSLAFRQIESVFIDDAELSLGTAMVDPVRLVISVRKKLATDWAVRVQKDAKNRRVTLTVLTSQHLAECIRIDKDLAVSLPQVTRFFSRSARGCSMMGSGEQGVSICLTT